VQTIENISRKYGEIETESVLGFVDDFKPYLRPMSSMTEEEKKEFESFGWRVNEFDDNYPWVHIGQIENVLLGLNWLNANHFDYRGLIEKGLAIAVTEKNNPYEN